MGYTVLQEESEIGVGDKTVSAVGVAPNTPHPQARTSWPLGALGSELCRELLGSAVLPNVEAFGLDVSLKLGREVMFHARTVRGEGVTFM